METMPPPNTPNPNTNNFEPIQILPLPSLDSSSPNVSKLAAKYKILRLNALKLEPKAFSSTYEREVEFTDDIWVSRAQNPRGKTYVAITSPKSSTRNRVDSISTHPSTTTNEKDLQDLLNSDWIGLLTLLGPEVLRDDEKEKPWMVFLNKEYASRTSAFPNNESEQKVDVVYMQMGMFVLPSWRGRGIGKWLIRAGIRGVRDEKVERGDVVGKSILTTMVESENSVARKLYGECRFQIRDDKVRVDRRGEISEVVAMSREVD